MNSKKQLREFSYLFGFGIPLIFGYLLPLIFGHGTRPFTLLIGLPVLLIGIVSPKKLNFLYKTWMFIGHTLGWVNSKIILSLVFIIVLQPISIIMKCTGYDPLRIKKKNVESYKLSRKNYIVDLNRIF